MEVMPAANVTFWDGWCTIVWRNVWIYIYYYACSTHEIFKEFLENPEDMSRYFCSIMQPELLQQSAVDKEKHKYRK